MEMLAHSKQVCPVVNGLQANEHAGATGWRGCKYYTKEFQRRTCNDGNSILTSKILTSSCGLCTKCVAAALAVYKHGGVWHQRTFNVSCQRTCPWTVIGLKAQRLALVRAQQTHHVAATKICARLYIIMPDDEVDQILELVSCAACK